MKKRIDPLDVETKGDQVFINQYICGREGVIVYVDQVDLLIEWLKEAKKEIEKS